MPRPRRSQASNSQQQASGTQQQPETVDNDNPAIQTSDANTSPRPSEAAPGGSDRNTEHAVMSELFEHGAGDAADDASQVADPASRRKRGPNWRGGELRTLVIKMDAQGVFDLNKSAAERQQAWSKVAEGVNRWAEEAEDAICSDRSGSACESQWRKTVYRKYKEGKHMSEIATGACEKTDEEWQPILVSLGEQWEDLADTENMRKEGKKRRKAENKKGGEAQEKACEKLGGDGNDEDDEGVEDDEEDLGVPKGPAKTRSEKPRGSALLANTIDQFVEEQERSRKEEIELRTSQHQQSIEEAREARETNKQLHRDRMVREDRRLDIEQTRARKEVDLERRLERIENGMDKILEAMEK
ncbi:hypothetical protein A4X09_0g5878 [Tilletia walkeri]|uniref:Uncharacterized protein n=1 Tax=Tilletia walkeri TaxID=117179 RepID=A0A8X7N5H7_9BASI|nr:hypothetical protein A4X09_0g5878 [Tilletia walkeri]